MAMVVGGILPHTGLVSSPAQPWPSLISVTISSSWPQPWPSEQAGSFPLGLPAKDTSSRKPSLPRQTE